MFLNKFCLSNNNKRFFSEQLKNSVYKDTIYSLGTGFGKSAIAILRISGPAAT
jgi:hypothetical protein